MNSSGNSKYSHRLFKTLDIKCGEFCRVVGKWLVENSEGVLDKEATSHDDCFDTFWIVVYVLALDIFAGMLVYL